MRFPKSAIGIGIFLFLCTSSGIAQNSNSQSSSLQSQPALDSNNSSTEYNPSLSDLGWQFGSGAVFGAAGGFLGGFSGYAANGFQNNLNSISFIFFGTAAGYLAGTSFGVYNAANSHPYQASFGSILFGSFLGTGIGVGGIMATGNLIDNNSASRIIGIGFGLSTVIIGGMFLNSQSIKKKKNQSSALLNVNNGSTQIASPAINLTKLKQTGSANNKIKHATLLR